MSIIFLIIIFLSIVLEATLISFPMTIILISIFSLIYREKAVTWAFMFGIVSDLFLVHPLGSGSLLYVGIVFIASVLQRKALVVNSVYSIVFIGAVSMIYHLMFLGQLSFSVVLKSLIFGIIAMYIFSKMYIDIVESDKKLTV